jgi:predicted nucleic acid-binding protein
MPVYIEFLAGVRNSVELQLATAYLKEFEILDNGTVEKADWSEAERVARRVPQDGRPRQLGDCLIRALAKRLRGDVATLDLRFHG